MRDMRANDVDVLTLGQYLRPTEHHLAVVEYVTPEKFDYFRVKGEVRGAVGLWGLCGRTHAQARIDRWGVSGPPP